MQMLYLAARNSGMGEQLHTDIEYTDQAGYPVIDSIDRCQQWLQVDYISRDNRCL